jgi:hypothetical protein
MAFDFLGTLSLEQLNDLRDFLTVQVESIDDEINTMIIEMDLYKTTMQEMIDADSRNGGNVGETLHETDLPDIVKSPEQNDSNSASLMYEAKKQFIPHIKYQRERLEFKIKKIMDYIEQTREFIDRKRIAKEKTSILLNAVQQLFNDDNKFHLFQTTEDLKNYKKGIIKDVV